MNKPMDKAMLRALGRAALNQTKEVQGSLGEETLRAFQAEFKVNLKFFEGSHWALPFPPPGIIEFANKMISSTSGDLIASQLHRGVINN